MNEPTDRVEWSPEHPFEEPRAEEVANGPASLQIERIGVVIGASIFIDQEDVGHEAEEEYKEELIPTVNDAAGFSGDVAGESEQNARDQNVRSNSALRGEGNAHRVTENGIPVASPAHNSGRDETIQARNPDVRERVLLNRDDMERVMLDEDARMRILGKDVSIAVPTPSYGVETREGTVEEPKSFRLWMKERWPWSGIFLIVIIALITGVAAAVGVVLSGSGSPETAPAPSSAPNRSQSAGEKPTSTVISMAPSFSPTKAPTTETYNLLRNAVDPVLGKLNVVEGSPQQKALDWLEFHDGFQINITEDVEKVQQRFALATFYFATGGDSWANNLTFMTDEDECNWNANFQGSAQGVINCENGRVTQLIFNSDLLVGSIPPEIQAWRNLTSLEVNDNPRLTNPIPEEITKLTALEKITIVNGNLTGSLPSRIGRITSLTELMLSGNSIGGSIPESIGNCTSLQILSMNKNQLVGPLPSTLGNLVYLKELDLSINGLTGSVPREVKNMASLDTVLLNRNDIVDGMENFCNDGPPLTFFMADCKDSSFPNIAAQVLCSCCTFCCNEVGACYPS